MEENRILLRGRVVEAPVFSHESHGKRFFRLPLAVPRLSGTVDTLNLLLEEPVPPLEPGAAVEAVGQVRSFNNRSGVGSRLVITVLVQQLEQRQAPPENALTLAGVLCKEPVYRRTPLGREICDLMLAVPRRYGRADYLPCIAWGSLAAQASLLAVGARLRLEGRLQSRAYTKLTDGGPVEKTAYEISVSTLEAVSA